MADDGQHVWDRIDPDAVIDLTRRLVQVSSENPPGCEEAVAGVLAEHAERWGLSAQLVPVAGERVNVVVTSAASVTRTGAIPPLLYCGHLDTVPCTGSGWRVDPLSGELSGGRIWGRGSVDMKGGLAAMLGGLAALRKADAEGACEVMLAAVVGEEVDCAGSQHFLGSHTFANCRWLVVGEPTDLTFVVAHKGALHLEITLEGRSAHGARPEHGVNAVQHMAEVIAALQRSALPDAADSLLGRPTMSVNTIAGGSATNVVPDRCSATVDLRTLPRQDHAEIEARILAILDEVTGGVAGLRYRVRVLNDRAPVVTDRGGPLIAAAHQAARATLGGERPLRGAAHYSDASVLQPATQLPTLLFGPGEVDAMHQVNESVSTEDLIAATRFFAALPVALRSRIGDTDPR